MIDSLSHRPRYSHLRRNRMHSGAAALALLVLVSCTDGAPTEAPLDSTKRTEAVTPTYSISQLSLGSCAVGMRLTNGSYVRRVLAVRIPSGLQSVNGETSIFAYRGWDDRADTPLLLAVCRIPDTPSARAYFETRFGGRKLTTPALLSLARTIGLDKHRSLRADSATPSLMKMRFPAHLTDGIASESPRYRQSAATASDVPDEPVEPCDAYDPTPSDACAPWELDDEPVSSEEPDDPLSEPQAEFSESQPSNTCFAKSDYVHQSTTFGYGGYLNGKSHTTCQLPAYLAVQAFMQRQRCMVYSFHCFWTQVASGNLQVEPAGIYKLAIVPASCAWRDGWYRTLGDHYVSWGASARQVASLSKSRRISCLGGF